MRDQLAFQASETFRKTGELHNEEDVLGDLLNEIVEYEHDGQSDEQVVPRIVVNTGVSSASSLANTEGEHTDLKQSASSLVSTPKNAFTFGGNAICRVCKRPIFPGQTDVTFQNGEVRHSGCYHGDGSDLKKTLPPAVWCECEDKSCMSEFGDGTCDMCGRKMR
jgi:hypothetical protein